MGSSRAPQLYPGLPTDAFNEDMGFDGVNLWHAHFDSEGLGSIRQLDFAGNVLDTFILEFGAVGMEIIGGTIWTTNWEAEEVGTFNPITGDFTPVFTVPTNAGGLAYDPLSNVLWVGRQGGMVEPYSLAGVLLGPGFQPFGAIADTIDGLAFAPQEAPEPTTLLLLGVATLATFLYRGRKT